MDVANFGIKLFGAVDIVIDGVPQEINPQLAKTLAMLVSARGPISPAALAAGLSEPAADRHVEVAPPVSRLRGLLRGSGLDIPRARRSHVYELVEDAPGRLAATVDTRRFEAYLRDGRTLLEQGDLAASLRTLREALGEWSGDPFASLAGGWIPPRVCESYHAGLRERRRELTRLVARVAIRLDLLGDAGSLTGEGVADGQEDSGPLWLLRFLIALRDEGAVTARQMIERRRAISPGDEAVGRARDLLALRGHGLGRPPSPPSAAHVHGRAYGHGGPRALIGRRDEILLLSALAGRLERGEPVALAVCGVPGVGKTRLVEELAVLLPSKVRMVTVPCQELGDLQPWRVLVGTLWEDLRRDLSSPAVPIGTEERETLEGLMSAGLFVSLGGPGHERDPRRLVALLVSLLRLTAGAGLLVVFDDAHLLRSDAEELLHNVREALGEAPVGFVLTDRSEPSRWRGRMDVLALSPLGVAEVAEWLGTTWGREPTRAETGRAVDGTGGLPLDLCRITEAGDLPRDLPRHDTASSPMFRWFAAAAVTALGREIDADLVAGMLELDAEEANRRRAVAVTAGTVIDHQGLRFGHDTARESLLRELKRHPALAMELHRRAFEILDEWMARTTGDGWIDPALPVRVAEHARSSGTGLSQERVAAACLGAARAQQRGFATEGAITWALAGLGLRCDAETRVGLLITLGDARNDAGDLEEAERLYLRAHRDGEKLPRLAAVAAIRLARRWSAPGQADRQLLHVLGGSLEALRDDTGDEAVPLRLQLQAHLAHKLTMAVSDSLDPTYAGLRPGVELARATLRELEESGAGPLIRCEVLNECRWGLYDFAPPGELLGIAERLREASIEAASAHFRSEAMIALTIDQLRLGRLREAAATVAGHRRHVARNHRVFGPWLQNTLDTLMDVWHGEFGRAEERVLAEWRQLDEEGEGEAVSADTLRQTLIGQHYWLLREQGRLGELFGSGLARQVVEYEYFPIWRAALVLALCEIGGHEDARDRLRAFFRETSDLGALPPDGWSVPTLALLAESCALLIEAGHGDPELSRCAALVRERLSAHRGQIALAGWPTILLGPTDRYLGLLALAEGDAEEALRCFGEALLLADAASPLIAHLHLDRARALRLRGGAHTPGDSSGNSQRNSAEGTGGSRGSGGSEWPEGYKASEGEGAVEGEVAHLLRRALRLAERLGMAGVAAQALSLL
ncbi:AAA family ATPase [Streptosporangium sp. NBC_01469]|uniref:AAA family ATPase n=1 Tax=Streptosporangium sp. NBC_01469 TaxID=2903898 RepID=UPI002E29A8F5|nr:AAA family ATPase [Streptosporangium sp. NBC_01469]